jgi:hypothetical protein
MSHNHKAYKVYHKRTDFGKSQFNPMREGYFQQKLSRETRIGDEDPIGFPAVERTKVHTSSSLFPFLNWRSPITVTHRR